MKTTIILFAFMLLLGSCKDSNSKTSTEDVISTQIEEAFNEKDYALNIDYKVGDVRRYGIFPDSSLASTHPYTKESKIKTVLDLCENNNIELFFPKGYYKMALVLDSRKNLNIRFDMAEFDVIHITNDAPSKISPENINLKGKVVSFDRLGITEAHNISIDTVYLKSDVTKNLRKMRGRGCHIYHGCNNIKIKYLEIDDFGSGDVSYQHNHAALAIDGYGNNPVNVQIEKLHIKSTDRHGIYITGKDHLIGEVIIDKFGIGSSDKMSGMQDASKGEEIEFKALWINKCYDSFIESITINEKNSKAKYTAHFDSGDKTRPFTIGKFKVINNNPKIEILEETNNGVIVELME
ncbi:hypothetical protein [Winogradskyella thalassocola]|uniref:Pectate lyase superfamily protein n=1 Tax=Winogradskyella thalassocola TaxID=262004 RepID=A0A1G7WT36_9FLAO|nr:hypothetical protein [Winogradskyella thalassocola]SDG75078.1 hypothetical protein SAMN04489796_101480 [Winogradskyella thalassocola]